jgi:biopolymer transport protein ExbD
MKTRRIAARKKRQVVPDLTPLIDVVFLLLIFFMVATTFDDLGGMRIDIPQSAAAVDHKDVDKISVLMGKGNEMKVRSVVGGRSSVEDVDIEGLPVILKGLIDRTPDGRVGILADRELDYGEVVDVMSIARENGAKSIDIETKRM